jgi:mono/diheme cytochrome c family protein
MPPTNAQTLPDAELIAIREWLKDFPQPTTGAALFADYCAHCHGDDARGGGTATNGVVTAYATAYHSAPFCRQSGAGEAGFTSYVKSGNGEPPSERRKYMPGFAGTLTDSEIALLWEFTPKGVNDGNGAGSCTTNPAM